MPCGAQSIPDMVRFCISFCKICKYKCKNYKFSCQINFYTTPKNRTAKKNWNDFLEDMLLLLCIGKYMHIYNGLFWFIFTLFTFHYLHFALFSLPNKWKFKTAIEWKLCVKEIFLSFLRICEQKKNENEFQNKYNISKTSSGSTDEQWISNNSMHFILAPDSRKNTVGMLCNTY